MNSSVFLFKLVNINMDFFLMIFLSFIFSFSRVSAEDIGHWNMDQPIYNLTGESFYLLYTTKYDLLRCIFKAPDGAVINVTLGSDKVKTNDERPPEWTWNWHGMDNRTDCGIQINNASLADNDKWHAVIDTANGSDFPHTIVKILPLETPDSIVLNPNTFFPYTMEPGSLPIQVNIICTAYRTRGKVIFTWWIGDNVLSGNVTDYNITNNTDYPYTEQYKDVSQMIRYFPVSSHDGKQLKCIVNHSEYTKEDLANKTNIAAVDITIKAPPVPQEEDTVFKNYPMGNLSIDIKFHANPPPRKIYWKMHDTKKKLGDRQVSGRYTSLGLKSAENGDYIATIRVSNLSQSDGGLQNILFVKNEIGNTTYTFTFKFDDNQVSGLKVGEIAGIVLACLGAVCLIFLVVSQLRKRKSKEITPEGAENREEMRETSRT